MIDTNIMVSALVFRRMKMTALLEKVAEEHTIVLCSYVIDEFYDVVTRKSAIYSSAVDSFLAKFPFEMVYTPKQLGSTPEIRDKKDKPILYSAVLADVDILITGDKDFYEVDIERPEILSPSEFVERYK